jgi:alkanesulfonate monooxygenase SsuD/methylene tetrahydromethanopterin reductase-like flavin-dependent oxidoreductase (luciferase family)
MTALKRGSASGSLRPSLPSLMASWSNGPHWRSARAFSSVGVIDRLVYDNHDPFVALAAAAAVTERAELVTTVAHGWVAPLFGLDFLRSGIASVNAAWSRAGRPGRPRILTGRYFCLGPAAEVTADEYIRHYYGDQFFAGARADTLTTEGQLDGELQRLHDAGCDDIVLYPCSADLDQIDRLATALDSLGRRRVRAAG